MQIFHLRFLVTLAVICLVASCAQRRMWMPQEPGQVIESSGQSQPPPEQQQREAPEANASAAPTVSSAAVNPAGSPAPGQSGETQAATQESYTQAKRYGDLWFLSGQIGTGARIEEQTDVAMRKVASVLAERGLNLANVVQVTVYLKDINDLSRMEPVYEAHFRGDLPARTVVAVRTLPQGALVQITAIAGR